MSNQLAESPASETTTPLKSLPMLDQVLRSDLRLSWQMTPAEQAMMLYLLERIRPKVAIEIGTRFGGSLQVISQYAERVYSLDIDPEVTKRLDGLFPQRRVSDRELRPDTPALVDRLQRERTEVGFVLVDGDHTAKGVCKDLNNLLKLKPVVPMYVLMHDTMNAVVRRGLHRRIGRAALMYIAWSSTSCRAASVLRRGSRASSGMVSRWPSSTPRRGPGN